MLPLRRADTLPTERTSPTHEELTKIATTPKAYLALRGPTCTLHVTDPSRPGCPTLDFPAIISGG
jgi:hypothetical protein